MSSKFQINSLITFFTSHFNPINIMSHMTIWFYMRSWIDWRHALACKGRGCACPHTFVDSRKSDTAMLANYLTPMFIICILAYQRFSSAHTLSFAQLWLILLVHLPSRLPLLFQLKWNQRLLAASVCSLKSNNK